MVYRRLENDPKRIARHRPNPRGLGRLLIMAATVALLSMGSGLFWWMGLLLLGLILLAVGRQGQAWWGIGSMLEILAALAFWHVELIPLWAGVTFLILGSVQFVWSLLPAQPVNGR